MKSRFQITIMVFLALGLTASASRAGNGSSGIGNGVVIGSGVVAHPHSGKVSMTEGNLIDGSNQEVLLWVAPTAFEELEANPALRSVTLGNLPGYAPQTDAEPAYYAVCSVDHANCVKLTPVSKTNPMTEEIIQSLDQD